MFTVKLLKIQLLVYVHFEPRLRYVSSNGKCKHRCSDQLEVYLGCASAESDGIGFLNTVGNLKSRQNASC